MEQEKQIEFERNEIAQIIAENFRLNDEKYDASDFEWSAYCVQTAGYRKERQGEWKPQMQELNYYDTLECSACEFVIDVSQGDYKYCPNCGAKMKGAE